VAMARLLCKLEAPAHCVLRRSRFVGRRGLVTDAEVHGTGFLTDRYLSFEFMFLFPFVDLMDSLGITGSGGFCVERSAVLF
jgi:hypothetical protein